MLEDTIAAISTSLGEGSVGIVRISGENAFSVAQKIFIPAKKKDWLQENYKMHYGHIIDGNGQVIDEVLITIMKAPHTYTRENVVEINCHGGIIPVRETLRVVLSSGARMAEPGEFTKRAFLNGRIDLAQAESVIDIIRSRTDSALKVAIAQLGGGLSEKVAVLQKKLLSILSELEVSIDFPEENIVGKSNMQLSNDVLLLIKRLEDLIKDAGRGRVYREGIKTVITGRPNVGKSSLLNVLLGSERAIVTHIPGTTRDVIEENLNVKGVPLRLIDTAGLRDTKDLVEMIGVEKTREILSGADLVLFVIDADEGLTSEDSQIMECLEKKKTLLVINKMDLVNNGKMPVITDVPSVRISALKGKGIDELQEKIIEIVTGERISPPESIVISSARHEEILRRARDFLMEFHESLKANVPVDILSIDLRNSWETLGEITGSSYNEDLLDCIFNDFCIGK